MNQQEQSGDGDFEKFELRDRRQIGLNLRNFSPDRPVDLTMAETAVKAARWVGCNFGMPLKLGDRLLVIPFRNNSDRAIIPLEYLEEYRQFVNLIGVSE